MEIIFARHGNTFQGKAPIPWLGPHDDVLLVRHGEEQAKKLASWLKSKRNLPRAIFCGPLRRSLDFARIIASELRCPSPQIASQLHEIDFGEWTGMTLDQIRSIYGPKDLDDW